MERKPTAEFAPVITNTPPWKSFDSIVLPLSRDRAELTKFLRVGQSSISGSIRWRELRLAISTVGEIAIIGPGAL